MDNISQKIAALSPAKRALLELKLKNKTTDVKTQQTIPKRTHESTALLSFAQQRLWFLEQLELNSPLYHIAEVLRLQGELNVDVLQQSLDAIVAHHEVLRTNFIAQDGDPIQIISEPRSVELKVIDLKNCPLTERSTQVQHLLQNESQRPFDLTSDLMLRACLLELEPQEYVLLLVMHHIASDGWSISILFEQFTTLYQAFLNEKPNPLAKQSIQYADYAEWQRQWLSGEVLENQLNYWKQQLANATPVLELPTDRARPPVLSYRGAKQPFLLPQRLSKALNTLSRQEGVTLYMTLLAAFQILLHRYSGQEDILVGSPIAGRNRAEIEGLIGFFVNTLVLRTDLSGNPSFRELLQKVCVAAMSAYANQELPFEKLVEELQPYRSLSYNPLFQVMFALQNTPQQTLEIPGLKISPFKIEKFISKFDLTLFIEETEQGLRGIWEYNTDLFDDTTITRMSGHFQTLLEAIVANPQQHIAELPLLPETERHQILVEWNQTQAHYPQQCIHKLFEEQVEKTPDAIALVFENQQLTYQQLNFRANQLAHYLKTLGVGRDVLVGICSERSLEMVVGLLGILKAGGAYVPLDPEYPQDRLAYMLADSQVPVLLTQEKLIAGLPQHQAHVVCLDADWEKIAGEQKTNPVSSVQPENLAYVIYTSGSTGNPKGVVIRHRNTVAFIDWARNVFTSQDFAGVLASTSICFDLSVFEIFVTLSSGGKVILVENALHLPTLSAPDQITLINTVPSAIAELLRIDGIPTSVRIVNLAGEALPKKLVQQIYQQTSVQQVFNLYGPSEDTTYSTFALVKSDDSIVSIGRPITNTQVYLLDSHLQPVPIGVPGELHIGGAGLAQGYLNRPELTAEKFISNPFSQEEEARLYKTGDLARYFPDGNIDYLGRIDHQVKIRGFRIELGEIEAVLSRQPAILQTVVIAREDVPGNKRLVAYVVVHPQQVSPNPSELRRLLKEKLPEYMVPAAFVFLDAMPLTPNGKVNRRALRAPDTSDFSDVNSFVPPRTPTEEALAAIWAEVLHLEQVGIYDNFFDLGGHSLLATQVISRTRQAFGVELPLQLLFETPMIVGLASAITESQNRDTEEFKIIPHRANWQSAPLSFAQQRLWFLEQLEPDSPLYYMPMTLQLQGELNVTVLQQALDTIVAHHEALRTNFIAQDGDPVQVISEPRSVELKVIDLKDCSENERTVQVERLLKQEAQRPFNLTADLMLRGSLLQLSPQEHILMLVMHHIASDGWSMGILYEQLTTLYQAFNDGKPNPLAELPIQYGDFAIWQREWLSSEVLDKQLNYWKQQLAGINPLLELPTDRQRPAVQTYRGAHQAFVLPKSLSQALAKLSRQEGVTVFMTLLAAFQTLLYRYSGQEKILVGSPIAGRNRAEIEGLIGFFVNTLVFRTDLSGNPNFRQLLQRVRAGALGAYAHQDLPFEKLVEELQPERSLSYNPLFQVMFALQNVPKQTLQIPGLTITPFDLDKSTSKFDITLFMAETEQGLQGEWEYNTDLFDHATIARMIGHFQTLLEGIVANPQQQLNHLPLLSAPEQHQLLFELNDTQTNYPLDKCIHQLFEEQAERTPEGVAVVFDDQQLTYQQLNSRANQLAHHLSSLGVGPDVLVGICVERSLEMVVGLLGILKAGGAYVPLDPAYPQERLSFMLSDSQVAVLLTCENLVTVLPEHEAHVVCLDTHWHTIAQASEENLVNGVEPENLAYVIYTSGSTGMPKGVAMKQLPLSNLISWQLENSTVSTGARTVQFSPISFDVSFQEIFSTWCSGGTLILITDDLRRDATALLDFLNYKAINRLFLPFVALQQLAEVAVGSESVPIHLQEIITAGEQLQITPALTNLFSKLPSCTLHNHYGPSESHVVTAFTLADSVQSWAALPPIGRPIANTSIYILDSNLQPVPIGVPGELYIGGVALARGYLNRPELTAEKFIRDPFSQKEKAYMYKTGDLARYLNDSNIEYFGRCDNQVKIRGFRIELGELEAVLSQHPAIHQAVVIVRQDVPGDKRLVAYVVPNQDSVPTTGELRHFLKEKLPEYMVPSAFVLLDVLPLTPSGKVNRGSLPAPDITKLEPEASYVAPRNDTEHQLTEIWAEILGIQPVGVKDNFFDLGGHSLLAVKLFAQIEKKFAKKLPLATLFQSGTVEALAQLLSPKEKAVDNQVLTEAHEQTSEASWSCLVPIQTKGSKPPLFCIHPLGGETLCYRNLSLHLGQEQPLYGLQPQGLDGKQLPLTRIEEMAALYIKEIQTIQPNGPYFLSGYSMGGIIAYEIAHQLNRQGQKVALLAMFDSGIPGTATRLPLISRIFMHINNLLQRGPSYLRKKLIGWFEWGNYHLRAKYMHFLGIKEPLPKDDRHWDIIDANMLAWSEYIYQPYSEQITLLRVDENSHDSQDHAVGVKSEPLLGWDKLVSGGIDVHYIPGSHFTLFDEPHVRVLAEKLKPCLEKAQRNS